MRFDKEQQRAAFERWKLSGCHIVPLRWNTDEGEHRGFYEDDEINREWLAWQAAAEQASQPPAGYKLVPIEPTAEMQAAGAQAIRFDTTPINKLWTGNAVYRAMISAIKWPVKLPKIERIRNE